MVTPHLRRFLLVIEHRQQFKTQHLPRFALQACADTRKRTHLQGFPLQSGVGWQQ
jgi:hypothetical protein